ncbi:hypothetical protein EDC04DRAFT_459876 [Pisolithus marmoratus]|nr:hypothetical protein EDC04DRAFT_459876 [Pisolithus marmoratus]
MVATLDLDKFSVQKLQTEEGLHDVFEHLNNAIAVNHIGDVVCDLLSRPGLFVYIFSVFPNAASMRTKILNAFPTDLQTLEKSFIPSLLSRTSAFFFGLPSDAFRGDESRTVARYERYVTDVWPAVAILSSIAFGTTSARNTMNGNFKDRKINVSAHDATILRKLNLPLPSNSNVAMQTLGDVKDFILQILKFYFGLLSDPRFADRSKEMFFSASGERDVENAAEATDVPLPAYTQAPYLEATLDASDIDRFGEWTILMSSSATKDLFKWRRDDAKVADCVLKKIRQLSRGQFSGNNYKMLHGPSHGIPIYQAEVLSNLRLVYQIDCALDDDGQAERQVVKVYGIYSHKQLDHIWPWLSKVLNGRGQVYLERCMLRELAEPGGKVYRPATFPLRNEEFITDESPIFVGEDGSGEDFSWLMANKDVKLSTAYLNGLIAEQEVELPIQLTAKEWQIVRCPTSCYVIGRSGTGKTTAMVYKMLGIHRTWEQVPGIRKRRQLFVTRFPVLAAKVEEFFTSLVKSLALAGCTQDELRNLRSQIKDAEDQEPQMIDPLNALNYRPGTPQKYSDLSDHDFPLFITFDQLARMIAADVQLDNPNSYDRHHFILAKVINDEASFITYDVFRAIYWPRLLNTIAQNFGPWLVFSEFMGVIKGSEKAFHSPDGILDRQRYVNLSARTYPVFAGDRHSLYNAFESYSKLKRELYGYDMADRTYAILKALSRNPLKGQPVDHLYVDEVQDNLIIDTMRMSTTPLTGTALKLFLVLRILCRNADGLFWAGDTAQTISAGSSFRFQDLKAFIHRTEAEGSMGIQKCCTKPELFELAINYRSHGGIVNCAQSVVKLITVFWPESVDILKPERAMLGGPKPVFFVGPQDESLPYEPFFSGFQGSRELGAEQCILVRDSNVRDHIRDRFGDIAVILTLQESKGLEFEDVFLYNFFEDSAALLSQWRAVLMPHNSHETAPPHDVSASPHPVLCAELKTLYVGITRARKKLYFLDHSQRSEPMRALWLKEGLIDVAPPTDICKYIGESSPERWAASAYKLFNAGHFQEAIRCFERAKLPRQLRIAQAYQLREVAMSTVRTGERQKAFLAAAEAFVQCAGEALGSQKTSFYGDAAKCYALADNVLRAAKLYFDADDITGAAQQYCKAGRFDKIVQILTRHREKISASYRNELLYICVVHYSRNGLRPPIPLFSSTEEELKYLKDKGLHKARIDLLASHKRFLEVADVQLSLGHLCDAIRTFLEHQDDEPNAMQRAVDTALDTLWRECSFDTSVQNILRNSGSDAHKVLNCIKAIPLERLKASDSRQIRFFRVIGESPFAMEVYRLGEEFYDGGEEAMALMAFDVFFSQLPNLHNAPPSQVDNFLRRFERYVRLVVSVVSDEIPFRATNSQVQKVFGIVPSSDLHCSFAAGSFLHRRFTQNRHLSADVDLLLKTQLKAHLRQKVLEESNVFCIARAFSTQCPYSLLHDRPCRMANCNQQHLRRTSLNATLYNMRVNLHLQQMRILDLMFSVVGEYKDWHARMTAWLHRLYTAIYCPIYVEGSVPDLNWNTVRNAVGCVGVARKWIQKAIEYLEPTVDPTDDVDYIDYFMNVIRVTCLHTALGGECSLKEYVSRESCHVSYGEQLLTEDDNVSADVVASLIELDPTPGVRVLRFLLQDGTRMDLSVVCNFAEEICSTFVSSLHPSGHLSPLHDLLVPRRWIMNPDKPVVCEDIIQDFLYCVWRLMNLLRSGKAHTRFDLPSSGGCFVDIMLTRMCRLLCILGYNMRDIGLSMTIAQILLLPPLKVDGRNPSLPTLQQLANLRRQYLETIQALDSGTAINDLVHLVHKSRCYFTRQISSRIPRVLFEDVADIARQMNRAPTL